MQMYYSIVALKENYFKIGVNGFVIKIKLLKKILA